MIETINELINMHGHGIYVWSAYGLVFLILMIQWMIPWRRLKNQTHHHE